MKLLIPALTLLLATCLLLQGGEDEDSAAPQLKIEKAQESVGSDFGAGASLLYHALDTEHLPGLEEWIVAAPAFELTQQPLTEPMLKMWDTKSLQAMISIRLPRLPLTGVTRSERGGWLSPKGKKIQCHVLYTGTTRLVYLLKEP